MAEPLGEPLAHVVDPRRLDGTPPDGAARALAEAGVDALGVNCGVGPVAALDALDQMAGQASGLPLLLTVPLKGEYSKRDIERSARFMGLPYAFPSRFPAATLAAARGYYWLHGQDCAKAREFAHAVFRAYWVDDRDIGELPVVLEITDRLGIDRDAFTAAIATPEIKDRLRQETDAAIARGMFGVPYFMVDGEPFWGADRLPQIDKWLATGGF